MLWNDSYLTGHAEIDRQHRVLFSLLDRVKTIGVKPDFHTSAQIVLDLIKYIVQHFGYEEDVMRQAGFPEAEAHRRFHAALTAHVVRLRESMAAGSIDISELDKFLDGWVFHHVGDDDLRLARFLAKPGG